MPIYIQYETKKGTFWELRAYLGQDEQGNEKRITRRGFKTQRAAQSELKRIQAEYEYNKGLKKQVMTFKQLYELWLEQYRLRVKPSSVATAKRYCENHILPKFGHLKLNQITISYCKKIVNEWHAKYKQYSYLKKETQKILKYGVSIEAIDSNPMQKIQMPRKIETDEPIKFYTKDELIFFLKHCQKNCSTKLYTFFRLIAFTGMRKSETLALRWADINFEEKTLSIGRTLTIDENKNKIIQEPKNKNSIRTIKLDDTTIFQLKKWKLSQQQELLVSSHNAYKTGQLIFTNRYNELYYPQVANDWLDWVYKKYDCIDLANRKKIKREYEKLLEELQNLEITQEERFNKQKLLTMKENAINKEHIPLKRITLHGFRYTHCSLLFESGASTKEVQARLGHKDVQTTMNIYACVTPQMIENTGEKFAKYIGF
ncbi:site-specific integrase [Enterococcus sp. SMC-9]|uniref:site-specific integrase n=1 Tax=Enterococcus sp. SMC-9 TaxID=2862343 RepID=UPI001E631E71|nr:site-specific integrase [Enterococcus sp. SMC-9]MCD1024699.1 site-specific integrase [Enterococcus sp. SMC-9]